MLTFIVCFAFDCPDPNPTKMPDSTRFSVLRSLILFVIHCLNGNFACTSRFFRFVFVVFDGDERQGQLSFLDWISDIVHLFSASASADKLRVSDYVCLYLVILNLTFNGR